MTFLTKSIGAQRLRIHQAAEVGRVSPCAPVLLRPICGGGCGGRATQWQQDIGPADCTACAKIALGRNTRLSSTPPEIFNN